MNISIIPMFFIQLQIDRTIEKSLLLHQNQK